MITVCLQVDGTCILPESHYLKCEFLLCVSCPSAKEFSAILFLIFARSSSNSPPSFQRFRRSRRQNFNWIPQQTVIRKGMRDDAQLAH